MIILVFGCLTNAHARLGELNKDYSKLITSKMVVTFFINDWSDLMSFHFFCMKTVKRCVPFKINIKQNHNFAIFCQLKRSLSWYRKHRNIVDSLAKHSILRTRNSHGIYAGTH